MPNVKNPRFELGGVESLTAGLFLDGSPVNAPPGSADRADNVLYTEDGSLQARPGIAPKFSYPAGYTAPYLIQRVYQTDTERLLSAHYQGVLIDGVPLPVPGTPRLTQVVSSASRTLLLSDTELFSTEGTVALSAVPAGVTLTGVAGAGGTLAAGVHTYTLALRDSGGYETGAVKTAVFTVSAGGSVNLSFGGVSALYPTGVLYRQSPGSALPLFLAAIDLRPLSGAGTLMDTGLVAAGLTVQGRVFMTGGQAACFAANRLWVVNRGVLTYSDAGSPFVRGAFNSEPINLPDGGTVTAVAPYNQGVVVFGLHSAFYITGPPSAGGALLPLAITDGCIGAHAWTMAEGQLAFCGRQHVYVLNALASTPITVGVRSLVREASAVDSTLVYSPRRQLLSLSLGTRLLTIQFRGGAPRSAVWSVPSYPQTVIGDELVLAQDSRLIVLNAENDEGAGVLATWQSTPQSFGKPHLWKLLRRAEMMLLGNGTLTGQLSVGEAFGDGSPDFGGSVQSALYQGGAWSTATWDVSKWGARSAELRVKLSVPSEQQGNFLRFRIDFSTTSTSTTFAAAPIMCEYRTRERLGRT